jgi:hypothetical protein
MKEKAEEFKKSGARIYVEPAPVPKTADLGLKAEAKE